MRGWTGCSPEQARTVPRWNVRDLAQQYPAPSPAVQDKRLSHADKPGAHIWIMVAMWAVADPERPEMLLDAENLLELGGPGCFKCELEYSRKLAKRPCTGSVAS